tara:strand:+ start:42 stop:494 length:453 start_codon:yes stop_codon:yes gene_type:complete
MATPYKMKGSPMQRNFRVGSPVRNGQATKGKLKKKLIGPTKPMVDKDGDGIPIGIDLKDTPGGKQRTAPKPDSKPEGKFLKKPKKAKPVSNTKTDPRPRPYDDGRSKGTLKGNTKFRSNTNKVKSGDGIELLKTTIKNNVKKAYNYFTQK